MRITRISVDTYAIGIDGDYCHECKYLCFDTPYQFPYCDLFETRLRYVNKPERYLGGGSTDGISRCKSCHSAEQRVQ